MPKKSHRTYVFYLIAIVIPLVILLLIEGILRVSNFRPQQPLFIDVAGLEGYSQPNPQIIQRFFADPDNAPDVSPDTQYFLTQKPANSLRIVVQGGSTAAGFPYGRWGSLSGMLLQQFKRLYPDKHIEIINTAMSSVNSYALLDFVDEIIEIKPDIVLIYAGHNEYLGIMGVGSAYASRGGRAANLLYLKVKDLKLYRLVESIYYAVFASQPEGNSDNRLNERTLMAQIAKDKDIPFQSELFYAGIEQFNDNMGLILDAYQQANIPVVLGDLASNEKDQIPFSAISQLSTDEVQKIALMSADQLANNIQQLELNIDTATVEQKAKLYFLLGHTYKAAGSNSKAQPAFTLARDYDGLRFRAPSVFNQVLANLADTYQLPLARVQHTLRADTDDGIIGSKHMLEHLHPSIRGYFLLAKAYVDVLQNEGLLPKVDGYDPALSWQEQPVSRADAAYGEFKIARLTADYPFTSEPRDVPMPEANSIENKMLLERLKGRDWLTINQALLKIYQRQKDLSEAAKISGLLADALPNNSDVNYIAGVLFKKANNIPLSTYHLQRAAFLNETDFRVQLSLAQNYFLNGEFSKSLTILNRAKQSQPNNAQIDQFILMVTQAKDKG
ncbi:hypothetical protein [Aliiglaciecola litoralis]|uniref:SGNH hydrolase-type esterase domain-containing protein n=1 Tax=Aliiglaciecola litoralis TaxID=582857 RepID=A0ABP3WVT5_9ALTE